MTRKLFTILVLIVAAIPSLSFSDPGPLWECRGVVIHQTAPSAARIGDRIRYEIKLSNEGNCDLSAGHLVNFIPRRSSFHSASPEPTDYPNRRPLPPRPAAVPVPVQRVEWKEISLPPESSLGYEVMIEVHGPSDRILSNTACFEHPSIGRVCSAIETFVSG